MRLLFGEYKPDQPDLGNSATLAKNVLPYAQAFGQLKSLSSFTDALGSASAALSSVWAKESDGTIHNHTGTATRLEALASDGSWSNISKAGNYSNAADWEWTQIGDRLIATDISNSMQYYDLGTSALYADLAGSPPNAKHIAAMRGFVVLGNVTSNPLRLKWSGYNNTEVWTPSRATQSDQRDLRGTFGDIQRIVPGDYGVVFQQSAISVMSYEGPPTIFRLDLVEKGRGTPAPKSVCWLGTKVFYLGDDGFYVFDGGSSQISTERVNRWFFNEVDNASISDVKGVIDPRNQFVIWTFKTASGLAYNDRILFYHWGVDKWSYGEMNTESISQYLSAGLTLDGLDAVLTDIDAESIPVDSDAYQGGAVSLVAFDSTHKLCTFQGAPLMATIDTGEFGETDRVLALDVRPLVTGSGNITIQHGYRDSQNENVTWGAASGVSARGVANFRHGSRFSRFRVNVTGGFENAIGVDVEAVRGGFR